MTPAKRTNATLRGIVTRRDKKIAALIEENIAARAALDDALRALRMQVADNKVLHNNIAVLQRPERAAKRNQEARAAIDVLVGMKPLIERLQGKVEWFERTTRRKL